MVNQPSLFSQPQNLDDISNMKSFKVIELNKDIPNISLENLLPDGAVLAVTNSYPLKNIHVTRILRLLTDREIKEERLTYSQISNQLSMSRASTKGTLTMLRKLCLIDSNEITPFGNLIINASPYIDDTGLLWLLHYLMASNGNLALWSNLFDSVLQDQTEISIQEILEEFKVLVCRWSENSIKIYAPKEIGAILRTYTDHIFSDLRIVQKDEIGTYLIFSNTGKIPKLIWLCLILVYRDRYYPGASALEVPLLFKAHYSPGRILLKNEAELRNALDELHDADLLTVEKRLGLDQVRFKRDINWFSAIKRYFQEQQ